MSKKNIIILSLILILLVFFVFLKKDEDTWMCKNGKWIKHGNPSALMPTTECNIKEKTEQPTLILNDFNEGDLLKTGDILSGKIKDSFFFEGSFPIRVEDIKGQILGISLAKSTTEWMTTDYVEFTTDKIDFDKSGNNEGYIIFKKDNPSGLPENDREIKLKVKF